MTIFHAAHPTDAEIDTHMADVHARARRAWAAAPNAGYVDNRREQDIDARAEGRRDQDNYEYAQLLAREESF